MPPKKVEAAKPLLHIKTEKQEIKKGKTHEKVKSSEKVNSKATMSSEDRETLKRLAMDRVDEMLDNDPRQMLPACMSEPEFNSKFDLVPNMT